MVTEGYILKRPNFVGAYVRTFLKCLLWARGQLLLKYLCECILFIGPYSILGHQCTLYLAERAILCTQRFRPFSLAQREIFKVLIYLGSALLLYTILQLDVFNDLGYIGTADISPNERCEEVAH